MLSLQKQASRFVSLSFRHYDRRHECLVYRHLNLSDLADTASLRLRNVTAELCCICPHHSPSPR